MDLNHTIVPSLDKDASATFFARIFGLSYDGPMGHFAAVKVNDALTLDFYTATSFDSHHLAFKVTDGEFDAIFGRVQAEGGSRMAAGRLRWRMGRRTTGMADAGSTSRTPAGTSSNCGWLTKPSST